MKTPIKMGWFGGTVPLFLETSKSCNVFCPKTCWIHIRRDTMTLQVEQHWATIMYLPISGHPMMKVSRTLGSLKKWWNDESARWRPPAGCGSQCCGDDMWTSPVRRNAAGFFSHKFPKFHVLHLMQKIHVIMSNQKNLRSRHAKNLREQSHPCEVGYHKHHALPPQSNKFGPSRVPAFISSEFHGAVQKFHDFFGGHSFVGGVFHQPLWNILSSKWLHLPQFSGWKFQKYLSWHHLGVSKNSGTPRWMVYFMENPIKMGWFEGVSPYFWKPPPSVLLNF